MKKDFFTKNVSLKIFSLVVAIILWFAVMNIQNPVTTKRISNIPVQIKNIEYVRSNGLYIENTDHNMISIDIRGPVLDIQRITRANLRAQVDLEGYALRKGKIKVPVEILGLPVGIEKEAVEMVLNIESLQTQQKTVYSIVQGELEEGYIYLNATVEPNTVQLQGPESKISKIARVIVNVNVQDKRSTVTTKVPVIILDGDGNQILGIESSVDLVRVEVPILKTKKIPLTYELKGSLPAGYQVEKEALVPEKVTIAGTVENIEEIKELPLGTIDLSNVKEDKTITAAILPPAEILLVDKIKSAEIKIDIAKIIEKTITIPLKIENLSKNLKVASAPASVVIKAGGTEKNLSEAVQTLDGSLDVAGLAAGEYTLPVKIENNKKFKLIDIPKVKITLIEAQ